MGLNIGPNRSPGPNSQSISSFIMIILYAHVTLINDIYEFLTLKTHVMLYSRADSRIFNGTGYNFLFLRLLRVSD